MDEDQYLALGIILTVFGMMFLCGLTYLYFTIKDCLSNKRVNTVQNISNTQNTSNMNESVYEEIL